MSIVDNLKKRLASARDYILVDHATASQRADICNSCEFLTQLRRCQRCGCFIDGKTKLEGAKCPIDKW
jgi:hypothetical protein